MSLSILENTPLLETERLILRKFTEEDAQALLLILQDEEVNTFLPWFPVTTLEGSRIFLKENYLDTYKKPSGYRYAICLRTDQVPIGYIGMSDDDSHDLGYGLRKEFWHQGIVTEAGKAVIKRLKKVGFPYITATHDINNPRSGQVMMNLGMTYRYSYDEKVQPKDIKVTFRMYQMDFEGYTGGTYTKYWDNSPIHFMESGLDN